MHSVRLAQLLRDMFFTQTLLSTVLFGWNPPFKNTTDNATVLSYEFKHSESS